MSRSPDGGEWGPSRGDGLRSDDVHPDGVRSDDVHSDELSGDELRHHERRKYERWSNGGVVDRRGGERREGRARRMASAAAASERAQPRQVRADADLDRSEADERRHGERREGERRTGAQRRLPLRIFDRRAERAQPLRASWDPVRNEPIRPRSAERADRSLARRRTPIGRFMASYGWRAYAIPLLVVITALAILGLITTTTSTSPGDLASAAKSSGVNDNPALGTLSTGQVGPTIVGAPPAGDGSFDPATPSGVLPAGGPVPDTPTNAWHVVPGVGPKVGVGAQVVSTYTVEVENGMDTSSFGGEESFARMVDETLANPKSWVHDPRFAFQRVDTGQPSFRISLSTPTTVRGACGYTIRLEVSCYNSGIGRVIINVARWVRGAVAFQGDIGSYRQYAINHEVGHGIGFAQHQPCDSNGGLAPVMMQQTISTANNDIAALDPGGVVPPNGLVCRFNPWPFPRG